MVPAERETPVNAIASLLMVASMAAVQASVPAFAHAQVVRVGVDPRAEVIGILFRLAGAPDFRTGGVQPYVREIDSAFTPFADHAVFHEINRLRKESGLSLSAVLSMPPQLTDPLTFGERAPIDAPSSTLSGSWRGAEARRVLATARDFARVARVDGFLRDHRPVFDSASARMRRLVDGAKLEWISGFFGGPPGDVFVVSPLLVNAAGNFAASFRDGATHERYAFVGLQLADSMGFPLIPPDALATIVHEFSHTFVNPVVGSQADLQPAGAAVYGVVQRSMRSLAYDSWPTMLDESVVRAVVIRYLLANQDRAAADRETRVQRGRGFVWMDELVALLGEYESQRSRYVEFAAFLPRLVQYYNSLAPRVQGLVAAFEENRPRVVSASIPAGAIDVDPQLDTLVVRFDRAVDPIITLVGNHGGGTPELTAARFDSAHLTLTLGIRLAPGRDYVLPLGAGAFVGRDGYALQDFVLRFRTATVP